jgi:diaminohydroxyphosphoribosylaminopyrimidine deaminase/5-amino-6-(5-phosphoribosylamino)uracil reductase
MTYNKKIVNKLSITKKSLWSLILAAKDIINSEETLDSSISINKKIGGKKYTLIYDRNSNTIAECNFIICDYGKMLFSLFFPIIFNSKESPYLIAHLAQTLDGFIATNSGESKYISSSENLTHIHMIRAISDIIIVGYKTVELDNPMLTTRLVTGQSPMRIIIDKNNKLSNKYNVFKNPDDNGYKIISDKTHTKKENVFQLPLDKNKFNLNDICDLLKKLRKKIVFIEGGGAIVSEFYNNNMLDRLHICISPSILGKGRSSLMIEKKMSLNEILEHEVRYFQMGADILCDIELS